jgi:hypothetical protein
LVIFDRLFGTLYFPDDRSMPEAYGVPEKIPDGFWNQLLSPLRSLAPIDDGGDAEPPGRIAMRGGIQQKRNIAGQP